jgi:hypothetical protein
VHCGPAHNEPLYETPLFQEMAFGTTGCPIHCPHHGEKIDYTAVTCPVAERVYDSEVIALGKDFLMDRIMWIGYWRRSERSERTSVR